MSLSKIGRIDYSALTHPPNKDELRTAKFFASYGFDIKFIAPSNHKGVYKADFWMNGVKWELKHPRSNNSRSIEDRFRKAKAQSSFIIFDLHKTKMREDVAIRKIRKEFESHPEVKKIIIVDKSHNVIEFSR